MSQMETLGILEEIQALVSDKLQVVSPVMLDFFFVLNSPSYRLDSSNLSRISGNICLFSFANFDLSLSWS